MNGFMNGYSKRIWVLVLGIAVAVAIAFTLLFNQNLVALRKPQGSQKLTPPSPSQLIKKTLEKISVTIF